MESCQDGVGEIRYVALKNLQQERTTIQRFIQSLTEKAKQPECHTASIINSGVFFTPAFSSKQHTSKESE